MKLSRPSALIHWVLPLMVLLGAVDVLLSGRDLSQVFAELAGTVQVARHPAMTWIQRGMSFVLMLICLDYISAHFREHKPVPSSALMGAFVLFWLGSVASPALFGAHPILSHEYLYALVIGIAMLLVTTADISRIVDASRTSLFLLMLVSVALIPIDPGMVLDASYKQGLLPGVPRLGGIAAHPVAMGMFAQTALLLLWARPYGNRFVNLLAWVLGLSVLFFAQSKTAWIAFILCSLTMFVVRSGPGLWRRMGDPREGSFGIGVCLAVMLFAATLLGVLLFMDVGTQVSDFLDTEQGAQITSLTGRDQIWAIAWEEWQQNKVFGYGPGIWDDDFRLSIGMPNATNAHNQFMDTLARSGTIGAIVLVIYAIVLAVFSLRHARRTGGLSIALFIALAMRSISEVPLLLFGYGAELFIHLMLVVVLASASSITVPLARARTRPVYGVPA